MSKKAESQNGGNPNRARIIPTERGKIPRLICLVTTRHVAQRYVEWSGRIAEEARNIMTRHTRLACVSHTCVHCKVRCYTGVLSNTWMSILKDLNGMSCQESTADLCINSGYQIAKDNRPVYGQQSQPRH